MVSFFLVTGLLATWPIVLSYQSIKKYKNVIHSDIRKLYSIYRYIEELIKSHKDITEKKKKKKIIKDAMKTQNINLCFKDVISLVYNIDRKYHSTIIKRILWKKKYWFIPIFKSGV